MKNIWQKIYCINGPLIEVLNSMVEINSSCNRVFNYPLGGRQTFFYIKKRVIYNRNNLIFQ